MAPITTSLPPVSEARHPKSTRYTGRESNRLRTAILSVLEPWVKRTGPEATFHFAVRQNAPRSNFTLLCEENDGTGEPFVLAEMEIRNGKIWLMCNETEADFATALLQQGVLRQEIVLGFLSPDARKDSDYDAGI